MIRIGNKTIGDKNPVYIIAEMSANHAGKLENALEIVRAVKQAGADCLKVQTFTPDTITLNCDTDDFVLKSGLWKGKKLYDLYAEASMPWEWQPLIKKECDSLGLQFLSTPFDNTAVDFLESMGVHSYKIASYELIDIPLIEYTASRHKPMIISCGMGNQNEIAEAVLACRRVGNNDIILLKCCSEYPAPYDDMNIAMIKRMKKDFDTEVGLSDHSEGFMVDVVAVAAGARIIEKHVCLSHSIDNPDSGFSMDVDEFAEMVRQVRLTERILGTDAYILTPNEEAGRDVRRSLYTAADIKSGEVFTPDNIRSVRPGYGLSPKYYDRVIGSRAACDIAFGTALSQEMVIPPPAVPASDMMREEKQ